MAVMNSPLLLLKSPLGDDTLPYQKGTLHAIAMTAREQLSRPFEIELTVVSTERAIDPNELLHQPVTLTCRRINGLDRHVSGLVRKFDTLGVAQRDRWDYHMEVVPRLWFLSQSVDCRIFQQMSAVEILGRLFSEHGVEPIEFRIFTAQEPRVYTTQFNETDLDFVHRLLQESGYFYFFEHQPTGSTLVIADRNEAFRTMERPLHKVALGGDNVDIFDGWLHSQQTTYGRVRLQDYDPTRPDQPVSGQQSSVLKAAASAERDVFRWPAMTLEDRVAADRARFRMQAAEAAASLRRAHGYDPRLSPGLCFVLDRDPASQAENVKHVVHSTVHTAIDETWLAGTAKSGWDVDVTCLVEATPWRDDLSIPRPVMSGIYSAIVLGEPGEEIHADELARIKVRPLFDHRKDTVADMAIWIRVLSAWAGNKWGWQHLPRVGTEVGISFMNGDPDNPVVVGSFYNENMRPVFDVPSEQTIQGFRSRSTLHGSREQYSELSFDDRIGSERVYLQAQKNHDALIKNDRTVTTTNNDRLTARTVTIEAAEFITLRVGGTAITLTEQSIMQTSLGVISLSAIGDVNVAAVGAITLEAAEVNVVAASFSVEAEAITLTAGDGAVVCVPLPV